MVNPMARTQTKTPVKQAAKTTKPTADKIVNQVIKLTKDYTVKTIDKWRRAQRSAENPDYPNRVQLYDLYSDLNIDDHYGSLVRRSQLDVTATQFIITDKNGNNDEAMIELFHKSWFQDFAEWVIETQFEGFSLLQLMEADPTANKICFELVERKNVVPEFGAWVVYQGTTSYINYRDDAEAMKWLIEVGKKNDLGMLNKMANTILFKKVAMLCHSEFCERFGLPLAKAKTNTRDIGAVNKLEKFLQQMASKSYAILDTSEELEFAESSKGDAYEVFDKMTERCNSEMSKRVRLQTLTTDAGEKGARSLGDVHQISNDDVADYNRKYFANIVNGKLLPLLALHGFKTDGLKFQWVFQKEISANVFAQDQWLDANFDIDEQFWADKYNVPIKGRKQKQEQPVSDPNNEETDDNADTNKKDDKKTEKSEMRGLPQSIVKLHADLHELYNHKH